MLNEVIRGMFKEGSGGYEVSEGDYEMMKSTARSETITATSILIPGTSITVAIIIETEKIDFSCPMPHCQSSRASKSPGGGFTWYVIETVSQVVC